VRIVLIVLQWVGIVFIAHALMLIGADEITTLERGGILTIRSLQQVLALYNADPTAWVNASLPWMAGASALVLGWPGWAILAGVGGAVWMLSRHLESS
jgi:hypothetical protein